MPEPAADQLSKDVARIQALLRASATAERQAAARKFAPTAERVYGVQLPVLNAIAQEFAATGLPLAQKLWVLGAFEERLIAAKIVGVSPQRIATRSSHSCKRASRTCGTGRSATPWRPKGFVAFSPLSAKNSWRFRRGRCGQPICGAEGSGWSCSRILRESASCMSI
ncbi:unnamed protein product, partial [Phaeothamnion confervicola]